MLIIESKQEGFRRCGIAHHKNATDYPDDRFTEEELKILEAEPMLRVSRGENMNEDLTEEAIVAAIHRLDIMDATMWTGDGKPRTEALEVVLKTKVSAKERNNAWERYQKENK